MAFYQVMLNGKDFCFNFDGEETKGGFYTTRWVMASTPEEAENKAVQLIKNDNSLQEMLIRTSDPVPMIYLEKIQTVNWYTYFRRQPGKGYTLYNEQDS